MAPATPSDDETIAGLQLIRSKGIGPVTYHDLIGRFGTAQNALAALPELAKRAGRKTPFKSFPRESVERELVLVEKIGGSLVRFGSDEYPANLRQTSDAPPFLTVLGDVSHLKKPSIGIVGARNASINGKKIAGMIATDLAKAGYTVWSGLARGIDTAAHAGALSHSTVAVMAGGVDVIYPRENTNLHENISEHGAIVSEMPPRTEPQARHFPRRNRIISGASQGVLVVEGTPKSGSLITARFALDQGRDVFAIPGSPLDPRAQGPNNLIRDGAVLVRSADDVLDELEGAAKNLFTATPPPQRDSQPIEIVDEKEIDGMRSQILAEIGRTPVTVDELRRQCQVSAPVLAAVLLELELAGKIERLPGGRICGIG
ncbi:MAG: DNA-protecting protein DprA [Alphaproteobacteria bacterium]|nr:DNA-protecting protein DprA [Alphaproteobacteria bacterium]